MIRVVVIVMIVVVGLALAAVLGPLNFWSQDRQPPAGQTPQPTPALSPLPPPSPQPTLTPTPTPPSTTPSPTPTPTTPARNVRRYTEKELQDKVNALIPTINQSGDAHIDYLTVKLEQDRMLLSGRALAMGVEAETKDTEIRFSGKTVSVSGQLAAFGFTPTITAVAEIKCESGKPRIELTSFQSTGALFLRLAGITQDKISQLINDAIVSKGLTILCDVESIRIEDTKLVVAYNK